MFALRTMALTMLSMYLLSHGVLGIQGKNTHNSLKRMDEKLQLDSFAFWAGNQKNPNTLMRWVVGETSSSHRESHFEVSGHVVNRRAHKVDGVMVQYFTKLTSNEVTIPEMCANDFTQLAPPNSRGFKRIPDAEGNGFTVMKRFTVRPHSAVEFDKNVRISESGVWLAVTEMCLSQKKNVIYNVDVLGHNAFGYLSGEKYFHFPMICSLFVVYVALSWLWVTLMIKWKREISFHHTFIAIGLHLLSIECLFRYFLLRHDNTHGTVLGSHDVLQTLHRVIVIVIATYVRVLVGFGSTGIGIAVAKSTKKQKIAIFSYAMVFMVMFTIIQFNKPQLHQVTYHSVSYLILLISMMDAAFVCTALEHMACIIRQLAANNQRTKYRMYRNLGRVLFVVFIMSVLGVILEFYFARNTMDWIVYPAQWPWYSLVTDGYWRLLFLIGVLAVVSVLRPNQHSKNYLYSDEIPDDTDIESRPCGHLAGRRAFTFDVPKPADEPLNLSPRFDVNALNAGTNDYQMWTDDNSSLQSLH